MTRALAVALVAGLLGCSRADTPAPARNDAIPSPTPAASTLRVRGLYTAGGADSGTIALCDGKALPARDGTGGELRRAHDALGGEGRPVFVEVRATMITIGPAATAHLAVAELVRASPVGEGAGCAEPPAPYLFRAFGNEPFWSATVGADSVVFEQPDEPRRTAVPVVKREDAGGRWTVQARTAGESPHEIHIILTPGRCSDSMSGALYSLSAEAVFDGRPLSGCAREGDLSEAP